MDRVNRDIPVAINPKLASDLFDKFCIANTLKSILGLHRQICSLINLRPTHFHVFYPKLKQHVDSWRARALWKKLDVRASHKCYARAKACLNSRVLIVGAGPVGLRAAIEAQLLGAKVVVIEKRDRVSRNNVLHLWPFVIEDLRALGAKKFFGKFCAGSIDHISIRQLQCILLKVALLLGVEIHTEISFVKLLPPPGKDESQERIGWRGLFSPVDHPVSQYEFDVIIGADGRRNTLEGFKRKEFRGRLAIAITANFINKHTEAEARVEEISGVAFIFNQKFFKDLYAETGIDLENIVYYKDDTHYFVMTAKKQSLLEKGVIINDIPDTSKLLGQDNVDVDELKNYAREAAEFSTHNQMPDLEFAVNHYGNPDVNMFDFTSMYAAENAIRVQERNGYKLLMMLVGDSLLEPFWPTGSGCARGFLSSMDACWALRGWNSGTMTPLEVLAERESIYRLLAQTTPENLHRDSKSYTLDPSTRYPNLNKNSIIPQQIAYLYDTDNPESLKAMTTAHVTALPTQELHKKRRRKDSVHPETLKQWLRKQIIHYEDMSLEDLTTSFKDGLVLCAVIHRYRPDLLDFYALNKENIEYNNQLAFDILEELGVPPVMTGKEMAESVVPDLLTMLSYLTQIYDTFRGEIPHIKHPKLDLSDAKIETVPSYTIPTKANIATSSQSRQSSRHRRSVDFPNAAPVTNTNVHRPRKKRSNGAGIWLDRDLKFPSQLRGEKDEEFSGRIKDFEDKLQKQLPADKKPKDLFRAIGKIETTDWNVKEIEKKIIENKLGKVGNKEKERVPKWSNEEYLARRKKMENKGIERQDSEDKKYAAIDKSLKQLDQKLKEGSVNVQTQNKVSTITEQFKKQPDPEPKPIQKSSSKVIVPAPGGSENCHFCAKRVYLMERLSAEGRFFHRGCFRCQYCNTMLRLGSYKFDTDGKYGHKFYCSQHFGMSGQIKSNNKVVGKSSLGKMRDRHHRSPEKARAIAAIDLMDRVQTPERVEFSNISGIGGISDHEESFSQMDEDEWTDRNFGASTAEIGSSDEDSSDSDSESDDDEVFEEAMDELVTKEGTHRLAKEWEKRYRGKLDDSDSPPEDYDTVSDNSYEGSSDDDESDTATEGEEEIRARELRKQEVRVKQPIVPTDTGSDTEMASDEETSNESSSDDKENSATDIPTDSEFDHDDRTPTSEIPAIMLNDMNIVKTRGSGGHYYPAPPKKVQVKSGELQRPINSKKTGDIELKFTPLPLAQPKPDILNKPTPLVNPRKGDYLLNRTQSTGGIASKISLDLKKKYLLGNSGLTGNIQKSGSTTTLDTNFKNFTSKISEHQKLLNPAPEISVTMQAFLQGTSKIRTPLSPTPKSPIFDKFEHICDKKDELKSPEIIDLTLSPNDKFAMQPDITKNLLPEDEKCESPIIIVEDIKKPDIIYNEIDARPRSPVHETSIIVPEITWDKPEKKTESDIDTDSLTSESEQEKDKSIGGKIFSDIPRVEIHDFSEEIPPDDDIVMDSLCIIPDLPQDVEPKDSTKSILSEKKTLNQPKVLPGLDDLPPNDVPKPQNGCDSKLSSGRNTPESSNDITTAALTETELSDWARDGAVSDNLEDVEFDINPSKKSKKKPKSNTHARIALSEDFEDTGHICGKYPENGIQIADLDSIEYMDTGDEVSLEENLIETTNSGLLKNRGYMHFVEEIPKIKPVIIMNNNTPIEAINKNILPLSSVEQNTGYCVYGNENENEIKEKLCDNDDDSLLIVETGTTTDETISDSTVKNLLNEVEEKQQVENIQTPVIEEQNGDEYDEHVKRLQSKYVEFGSVRDSIDIRKSKRKNIDEVVSPSYNSPATSRKIEEINKERSKQHDLIRDLVLDKVKLKKIDKKRRLRESYSPGSSPVRRNYDLTKSATIDITPETPPSIIPEKENFYPINHAEFYTPVTSLKDLNPKTLARPLSMHGSFIVSSKQLKTPPADTFSLPDIHNEFKTPVAPPRVKHEEAKKTAEKLKQDARARARLMSDEDLGLSPEDNMNIHRQKVSKPTKNTNIDECIQDSIESLVLNTEKRNAILQNDTLKKKKPKTDLQTAFSNSDNKLSLYNDQIDRSRTKSVSEICKSLNQTKSFDQDLLKMSQSTTQINKPNTQIYKSDPNLLSTTGRKERKTKDPDRRKSIIKSMTEFFQKKKEPKSPNSSNSSGSVKDRFSKFRISPKSKDKSKSCLNLDQNIDRNLETSTRSKSLSENPVKDSGNVSPPPIPPPPLNYSANTTRDESGSDGDCDWKKLNHSSETLDQSCAIDGSTSLGQRRCSRSLRKASKQAQIKRHRLAQEIQRKLEETEVKTRELEHRGVEVEKALRGETTADAASQNREEEDLLREWFDLMRDRTELRRYEKELLVRAEEIELEDRHARLQHELQERLEGDVEEKTPEEVEAERAILERMFEIVSKRDSLVAELEKDRLRYHEEDRDFEAQMLAKGLRLTPIKKTPD